jgi:hypothetical protein
MAFKMKGFSGFKQKVNPNVKVQTSVEDDGDKYYTYETTLYDYHGNLVKGIAEEDLSQVFKNRRGEEYAKLLYDVGGYKEGDTIWYDQPK